jgi:hypothetical protein
VGRAEALSGQLAEATEQLAEASARAGTLAEDLAVAVGSAQSAQAVASQEHARAKGMFRPLCDLDSASFFNPCLKNFVRLSAESIKALAQAVEQKEADRVAMSGPLTLTTSPRVAPPRVTCGPWAAMCAADSAGHCTTALGGPSPCLLPTTMWI